MNRAHPGANRGRSRLHVQADYLQRHPGPYAIVVPRRIAAAMQVNTGRDGSFDERFAQASLSEDNQWNGTFDARASARFFSYEIIRSPCERRLAHVFSLVMQPGFPMVFGTVLVNGEFCRSKGRSAD